MGSIPPWEDPAAAFPRNFIDTWTESVSRPGQFFGRVPFDDAAARPILYYLLISIICATFSLWWTAMFTAIGFPLGFTDPESWAVMSPAASALVTFFATPFLAFFGLIIWAGLVHVLVLLLARDRRGYRATLRAVCYGAGPTVLSVIPFLGALVGFIWSLAITSVGIREAHGMSPGAATAAIVLAALIPIFMFVSLVVTMVASVAAIA